MKDKDEVLERFCAALAELVEAGLQDMTPEAKISVVQGAGSGTLQIALAIRVEPFEAIAYAAPKDH